MVRPAERIERLEILGRDFFFLSFGNYGEFFCGYLVGISWLLTRKVFSVMFPRIQPFYVRGYNSLNKTVETWALQGLRASDFRIERAIAVSLNVCFFCFIIATGYGAPPAPPPGIIT